jgi:hypothetical protein
MKLSNELTHILNRNCLEQFNEYFKHAKHISLKSITITIDELKFANELIIMPNLVDILVCRKIFDNEFVSIDILISLKKRNVLFLKLTELKYKQKIVEILS